MLELQKVDFVLFYFSLPFLFFLVLNLELGFNVMS